MPDRRGFSRIRKRYLVDFVVGDRVCAGFTHDLSPTGMFICSVFLPRPGTPLRIRMRLGTTRFVTLRAKVVRSYRVPQRLARFVPSGFCVVLQNAPEEYFQFLASVFGIAA
jgi:PilZ domain